MKTIKRKNVNITVERIDEINFVAKGTVENSVIEQRIEELKKEEPKEAQKDEHGNEIPQPTPEQLAAEQVFKDFIKAAVEKAEVNPDDLLGQPGLRKYEKGEENVFFEVELATSPKIDLTNFSYDDIIPEFNKPEADPAAVQDKMLEFATKQAPITSLKEPRALENDDIALINFEGFIDGVAFEGGKAEKHPLKIGSLSFIDTFEEQLIGMEYGEHRTVTVKFPDNYSSEDLAGKEAKFEVELIEIQEQYPVEINDEFAQKILGDPKATVKTLTEKFEDQITSGEVSQIYMTELKPKIVEGLLSKIDFVLPNNVVEQEIDGIVRERMQALSKEEQDKILQDKEAFFAHREAVREEARASIKKALLVEELAKKEGIETDEHEAMSALTYQAMMSGQDAQQLVKFYQDNNLMSSVILALTEDKLFGQMIGLNNNSK
jgi:trigger factor